MEDFLWDQPDLRIVETFSTSSTAETYHVEQTMNGQAFDRFVKVLKVIDNAYAVKRSKDLLAYLNQYIRHFPTLIETRKVGNAYLFIFNFVASKNLEKFIKKKGYLPDKQVKNLLRDLVLTLEKAHKVGFVHTDIRPENILLSDKHYYLVNWSKAIPKVSSFDTEDMVCDHLYTPPERLNAHYDEKGDVYQLGCMLYYALTGKHIYRLKKVSDPFERLYAHAYHSPKKINNLSIFWRQLIIWMTQKDPANRPSLEALKSWLDDRVAPKWIRKLKIKQERTFPTHALSNLSENHYQYANYVQALKFEKQKDLVSAFNAFESLSFFGFSGALVKVGRMYEMGQPIKCDYSKAIKAYQQAFEKGNAEGAYYLANMYQKGIGMPKNAKHAYKLFYYSAMRGNTLAQKELSDCYRNGLGVEQDITKANFWQSLAEGFKTEKAIKKPNSNKKKIKNKHKKK